MPPDTQIFQSKTGVKILVVIIWLAGMVLVSIHIPFGIPDKYRVWIIPFYALGGVLWLADVFLSRIVLGPDTLRIVSPTDFLAHTFTRAEIAEVSWTKIGGARLTLRDGKKIRFPSVDRDPRGLTNTIRAWLKRTETKP
ncbi:MAG TPA: hypothetical protein VK815_09090 [Candidatus Acidoferrales bacterium]|jgi:hypothetical protein|nr:hypothetical protein [Candidatus Acidoferrales bacterium]